MKLISVILTITIWLMLGAQQLYASGSRVTVEDFTLGSDNAGRAVMMVQIRNQGAEAARLVISIRLLIAKTTSQNEYSYRAFGRTQVSEPLVVNPNKIVTVRIPLSSVQKPGDYAAIVTPGEDDTEQTRFEFSIAGQANEASIISSDHVIFPPRLGRTVALITVPLGTAIWLGRVNGKRLSKLYNGRSGRPN